MSRIHVETLAEIRGHGHGRLGRHIEHDQRSRDYDVAAAVKGTKLHAVAWDRHGGPLDQGATGSCFPPGTRCRMADGSERRIEDVRPFEEVLTAEENVGRVSSVMARLCIDGLLRVGLWGHAGLRLTSEHPVLTERGYIAAGNLNMSDWVRLPRYLATSRRAITPLNYIDQRGQHRLKRGRRTFRDARGGGTTTVTVLAIPEEINLSSDFGRLLGLFLAEGGVDYAKAKWHYGAHEKDTLVAETEALLRNLGLSPHVQHRPNNSIWVGIHGVEWAKLFSALCGHGGPGFKAPHPHLLSAPREFQEAMLDGWLDGDGHDRRGRREGVTISRDLALAMYDIAQGLGRKPVLSLQAPTQNKAAKVRQPRWVVTVGTDDQHRGWQVHEDRHGIWRKVRLLQHEEYAGPVYNLSIEGDESYVAEGIGVHNCTGQALAGLLNTDPFFKGTLQTEADALRIYGEATHLDHIPGTYPEKDTGSSGLAVCKAAKRDGLIGGYRHAFSIRSALQALMHGPVITGVDWTEGFDSPNAQGLVEISGTVRGGHEFEVVSYDPASDLVGAWNSWGSGFGVGGKFCFTSATWRELLARRGDVTVPVPV